MNRHQHSQLICLFTRNHLCKQYVCQLNASLAIRPVCTVTDCAEQKDSIFLLRWILSRFHPWESTNHAVPLMSLHSLSLSLPFLTLSHAACATMKFLFCSNSKCLQRLTMLSHRILNICFSSNRIVHFVQLLKSHAQYSISIPRWKGSLGKISLAYPINLIIFCRSTLMLPCFVCLFTKKLFVQTTHFPIIAQQ